MKMLYVGAMSTKPDRDSGWVRGFKSLGWEVLTFSSEISYSYNLVSRAKKRLSIGGENIEMQRKLLSVVNEYRPSWVHFRLPIEIDLKTIIQIRKSGVLATQYYNDDPFSPNAVPGLHWKFKKALPAYDAHFVYRQRNVADFQEAGALCVIHCPPTYDPVRHYISTTRCSRSISDAAFIGHWENDQRVAYLEALANEGFTVLVHGSGWNKRIRAEGILGRQLPITPLFGVEYNQTYRDSSAGLCFFSKMNRDLWTERPLEIIAVGGVLVCERTEEALSYFVDRKEALFFSTIPELIEIVRILKSNTVLRESIRKAGYSRLINQGHSIFDRAKLIDSCVRSKLSLDKA